MGRPPFFVTLAAKKRVSRAIATVPTTPCAALRWISVTIKPRGKKLASLCIVR